MESVFLVEAKKIVINRGTDFENEERWGQRKGRGGYRCWSIVMMLLMLLVVVLVAHTRAWKKRKASNLFDDENFLI